MDEQKIEEAKLKLQDIDKFVSTLDPEIRASAFQTLSPLYFQDSPAPEIDSEMRGNKDQTHHEALAAGDRGSFFASQKESKPKDNVMHIVAWLYGRHGVIPLNKEIIDTEANEIGVTVSKRSDNFMRAAKEKNKNLFKRAGKNWELTVSGELAIQNRYGITKGNIQVVDEIAK